MFSTVQVRNVPVGTVRVLAKQLHEYGCVVEFDFNSSLAGKVRHDAGVVNFDHDGMDCFTVVIEVNAGHFPGTLLIGGIKQLIEEAAEDVRGREAA